MNNFSKQLAKILSIYEEDTDVHLNISNGLFERYREFAKSIRKRVNWEKFSTKFSNFVRVYPVGLAFITTILFAQKCNVLGIVLSIVGFVIYGIIAILEASMPKERQSYNDWVKRLEMERAMKILASQLTFFWTDILQKIMMKG